MMSRKTLSYLLIFLACFMITADVRAEEFRAEITNIDIKEIDNFTEIQIKSNSLLSYTIYRPEDPYKVVVELQGVELGRFKDKMTIDRAGVAEIIPSMVEGAAVKTARLEIILTVPAEVKPVQQEMVLALTFYNPEAVEDSLREEMVAEVVEEPVLLAEEKLREEPSEVVPLKPEPFTTKEYMGEKISLDFQDADLVHVFRLLADVSGYNIVVSPQVKGKFSMKLLNIPWDQALDIILRNYSLSKTVEGSIIRIAPTAVIAKEEEEIAKAKEAAVKAGDLETRIYSVNYADVKKIREAIKDAKIMSKRGFISIDERTSSIIIRDVESMHKEFERLIKSLDLPTSQVNIEAKIVEVSTNFQKELGIQWGALWRPADSRTTIGGTSLTAGTGFNSGNNLMVNLPATVGEGSGGIMGIGYISAGNTFTLDLQLSAMESSGKGKIISNPRITTIDNQEATIQQGRKIPYQTVSAEGTKTEFVDASLQLTVTPHITPEGTIVMKVEAKKNDANFDKTVGGVPTIDTKEAKTQVLIKDGDTLVIGGIFKTTTSKSQAAVPGLSKIPVLGWLFKQEKDIEDTSELLIFITPRIVKQL